MRAYESVGEKEQQALEVKSRRKIYSVVTKSPGSHLREIERKSGLALGTVKYHLNYLARHGLIKEQKEGGNLRYFPLFIDSSNQTLLGFLRQKSMRDILLCILTTPPCNHEAIVAFAKLSPSTITFHLKKLEEAGIISAQKEGRKTFYNLLSKKEDIQNLLIAYQESFLDTLVDNVVEMWQA